MNKRSLLLLLATLGLACAGLFLLLRGQAAPAALEESRALDLPVAGPAAEAELQSEPAAAARSAGNGEHLGTPRTPARDPLSEAQARVAGFLRPHEDKPWHDASVALLAAADGGPPAVLCEGRCDPDGGFVLTAERSGRALFVVCTRGYLPRVQELELVPGHEELLEDLDLDGGVSIGGTLTSNARPLARFEVVAIDERDLPVVKLKAGELLCSDRGFDWRFTTAESGADGRYSIGGLHAGDYSVRVATCRGPMASLCASERSPRAARAPRTDLDFAFESSTLALRFQSAGQPLAGVEAELVSGSWRSGKRSDAHGVVAFQLVPRLDCTLVATKQGFAELRLPVSAPASGASAEESFEMQPKAPTPELRFVVSSPSGDVPPELRVRLHRQGTALPVFDETLRPTQESFAAPVKVFVLRGMQAGAYRAVLLPGQPWNNELEPAGYIGTHCALELALELREGEQEQRVSVERRPALRLAFKDESQRLLPARCTLRDNSGNELPIVLVDPAQGIALPGHELSTLGPTLCYSALCEGKALVSVDYDGRSLYSGTQDFHPGAIAAIGR